MSKTLLEKAREINNTGKKLKVPTSPDVIELAVEYLKGNIHGISCAKAVNLNVAAEFVILIPRIIKDGLESRHITITYNTK